MTLRSNIISVIGSGTQDYSEIAAPLGEWIARQGFHLCNGGGSGVMRSTAEAFVKVEGRQGKVLGILPSNQASDTSGTRANMGTPAGYPNPFVDIPIKTHLHLSGVEGQSPASRNHIVVLTGDIIVALPGGAGTRSEIQLALDYRKPIILLQPNNEWQEFNGMAESAQSAKEATAEIIKLANSL